MFPPRAPFFLRRALELHWPALLVASVCIGLAASIWISIPFAVACALVVGASLGVLVMDGTGRLAAIGAALMVLGMTWGSLRMDALRESVLESEIGESGIAELVTVAPARASPWSTRVIATTRTFRREPVHERVLLVLPVGRSPPRGTILEASVRVADPRPAKDGFDERAWLGRQGIHVVLEVSSWHELGRRGGLAGVGDRLRDRIEQAVGRGTDGVRRGIVLGVVLGEDEGLPADVQADFRASGLYHLLRPSRPDIGGEPRRPSSSSVVVVNRQSCYGRSRVAGACSSSSQMECQPGEVRQDDFFPTARRAACLRRRTGRRGSVRRPVDTRHADV
jgi:predicted membrane metal-binding protein